MTRETQDEANRKLAVFADYSFGDDGLCIEPSGHFNVPVPDFYTDEAANALLLEKMPDPMLWKEFDTLWGCEAHEPNQRTSYVSVACVHADRKTAICEAALKYLASVEGQTT